MSKDDSSIKHIVHFLKDIRQTGAVMPSSRFLAGDVVKVLRDQLRDEERGPIRVLEVGAGTGTFTGYIHKELREDDHMDVVELNNRLFRTLSDRYSGIANLHLHHTDILDFEAQPYDYIYSSIPYESIPARITKQLWAKKLSLCRSGSSITYYKYVNFNHFRCKYEKELVRRYGRKEKVVYLNVPPAKLYTLTINDPKAILEESNDSEVAVS